MNPTVEVVETTPSVDTLGAMVPTFLYSLAGGMLAVLATSRVEQIASKFLRLVGLISFALSAGVAVWVFRQEPVLRVTLGGSFGMGLAHGVAAVGVVLLSPFASRKPNVFRVLCAAAGVLGLAAGSARAAGVLLPAGDRVSIGGLLAFASQALGGLLLGSVTVAWLLGHAYLTATKMTIAPLRHFSRMLSWAVSVRVVFLAASLTIAWTLAPDTNLTVPGFDASILTTLGHAWLILSLRVGVGLVGLGVFAYMVSDCVRLRSTQSATGILYFGSVFAYIGELASQYLLHECGWPL